MSAAIPKPHYLALVFTAFCEHFSLLSLVFLFATHILYDTAHKQPPRNAFFFTFFVKDTIFCCGANVCHCVLNVYKYLEYLEKGKTSTSFQLSEVLCSHRRQKGQLQNG